MTVHVETTDARADGPTPATTPVRVAIVDDHESVRLGIRAACQEAGFEVVAVDAYYEKGSPKFLGAHSLGVAVSP